MYSRNQNPVIDLHQFDDVPFGGILKGLGNMFLADEEIQKLAAFYGNHELKVREEELRLILHFIHNKALILCIQKNRERKTVPEKEANSLLNVLSEAHTPPFPLDLMEDGLSEPEHRALIAAAEIIHEDMTDLHYVRLGFDDETFLYGARKDDNGKAIKESGMTDACQRRNWMTVSVDFPRVYVDQLKEMIYPECYVVCFSGKNDDSSMWGNYADHHRGVCLIYETDQQNKMAVKGEYVIVREVKPVNYEGSLIERNFFESFGRLTLSQIRTWLTGTERLSSSYEVFHDEDAWRQTYWAAYESKTYRKLKAWEHENEYRLALENTFYTFDEPESRNLKYDPKSLKGLIFGINTPEYDKKRIYEKLLDHASEYGDFTFYQAEYNDETQSISIRAKSFWQLKSPQPTKK